MRILGIDPGSRFTGFGVVELKNNSWSYITSGHIKVQGELIADKLKDIFEGISSIIIQTKPDEVAVEQIFMHKNANSALKLGHARGAAIVAAANYHLPVLEYSARQVKQAVVGYGAADKEQVQHMISKLLKLDATPQEDAADALAVALCHGHQQKVRVLDDR